MKQAENSYENFYMGWDSSDEKKNRLINDSIHRSFRKKIIPYKSEYFETIGITKYFLGSDNALNTIQGITYPSVASGVRGGNFAYHPEDARRSLLLREVRLFKIFERSENHVAGHLMATTRLCGNKMNWSYAKGFY